jgi:hypothetical protein
MFPKLSGHGCGHNHSRWLRMSGHKGKLPKHEEDGKWYP